MERDALGCTPGRRRFGSPYLTGVPTIRRLRPAHPDPAGRTYGALAAAPLLATVRDPLRRGSLLPYRAAGGEPCGSLPLPPFPPRLPPSAPSRRAVSSSS